MCCRVVRSVAVAGTLVLMFAGVAWSGWGLMGAQEATPAPSHGRHSQASSEASERSPYADTFDPEAPIRSLTPQEIAQIERGEGAGFALPAELNGVPGPRHVLDLAHELDLSHAQVTQVQVIYDQMQAAVIPLGQGYLGALQALEADFRAGTLTAVDLPGRVAEVKRREGELAAAHLVAHLETAELLTPEQIGAYNQLRGYQ